MHGLRAVLVRRCTGSDRSFGSDRSTRRNRTWYFTIILVVLACALGVRSDSLEYFQRFLGRVHPLAAVVATAALGAVGLAAIRRRAACAVAPPQNNSCGGLRVAVVATLAFGAAIVAADVLLRYPRDINVPMPHALLFYPVIGFIAEIVFHVVPVAVAGLLVSLILRGTRPLVVTWVPFMVAALSEPIFQVVLGGNALSAVGLYTGVHVLAFSLVQLLVFRRFGFAMMLLLRLAYYAIWHIGWGVVRLEVLFSM